MAQAQETTSPEAAISSLVQRCQSLCQSAESALSHLPKERGDFLATNLVDVLSQLELVLRAVGQDPSGPKHTEERKSFLRKLFGRSQADEKHVFQAPSFDVTRQGLQGNASTIPMAELLSFLAMSQKTGALWVDAPEENFMIGLVKGNVVHAASDKTPEGLRLGEVLVGLGYLTRRQLDRFVEQAKETKELVSGEYLVKNGMISAEELDTALKQQIQKLIQRIMTTKTALFRFREGMEMVMAHSVKLDVNHLLLEGARVQDESANASLRTDVATASWNSWQNQLTAEVADATGKPISEPESKPQAETQARLAPEDTKVA